MEVGLSDRSCVEVKLRVPGPNGHTMKWFRATLGEHQAGRRDVRGRRIYVLTYNACSSLPLPHTTAKVSFEKGSDWVWDHDRKKKNKWRLVQVPTPKQAPKRRADKDPAVLKPAPKRRAEDPAVPVPATKRRVEKDPAVLEPAPKRRAWR